MNKLICAFSNNNGKNLTDKHFGDAEFYDIYEISDSDSKFIKKIKNSSGKGSGHMDEKKAKGVSEILKESGVKIVISKRFGPNILRIKSKFVCVILSIDEINESIKIVQNNLPEILSEWEKGENRSYLKY